MDQHDLKFPQNNACPDWSPVTLDCAKLCLGDWSRPLRLEVFDWDMDGGHDFIGACVTNLETLVQGEDFQIVQVKMRVFMFCLFVQHSQVENSQYSNMSTLLQVSKSQIFGLRGWKDVDYHQIPKIRVQEIFYY